MADLPSGPGKYHVHGVSTKISENCSDMKEKVDEIVNEISKRPTDWFFDFGAMKFIDYPSCQVAIVITHLE